MLGDFDNKEFDYCGLESEFDKWDQHSRSSRALVLGLS